MVEVEGVEIEDFLVVDKKWRWRGSAVDSVMGFIQLGRELGIEPRVARTHTSKSIRLPVVQFDGEGRSVQLVDNFYDLDIHYEGPPVYLTYAQCGYTKWTGAQYLEIIARRAEYGWAGWSEDEILDPRITRVQTTHPNGSVYWNEHTPEEKRLWAARYHSTEWYSPYPSSSRILGDVAAAIAPWGSETPLWLAPGGADHTTHRGHYAPNAARFTLVFPTGTVLKQRHLIRTLLGVG